MNYQDLLKNTLKASTWTQERLAVELGVTFSTLNSWINGKSTPRAKSLARIENLYFDIVGVGSV